MGSKSQSYTMKMGDHHGHHQHHKYHYNKHRKTQSNVHLNKLLDTEEMNVYSLKALGKTKSERRSGVFNSYRSSSDDQWDSEEIEDTLKDMTKELESLKIYNSQHDLLNPNPKPRLSSTRSTPIYYDQ